MKEPRADADVPVFHEQVSDDGRQPPAEDSINPGETVGEAAVNHDDVLALHKLLKRMEEDDEDAIGEVQELREMLRKKPKALVDAKGSGGAVPLHIAAERGLKRAAEVLLGAQAKTSIQDDDKFEPLHYACEEGYHDVAELLIKNGANIDAKDRWYETPLHKACRKGHADLVELLLEQGAKTNIIDDEGMPPLYYTARYDQVAALKALLGKGKPEEDQPNINYVVQEDNRWTALHVAAYYGHDEIVAVLHKSKAKLELDPPDDTGDTPLLLATKRKHLEVMRDLLCYGHHIHDRQTPPLAVADVNAKNEDGDTPLMVAAGNGFLAGVRLLIEVGADCHTRNNASRTPIIAASLRRNQAVLSVLLERERDNPSETNAQDGQKQTALPQAASRSCEKPKVIDAQDETKQTALHKAARKGHVRVLELLLENGAETTIRDGEGRLALHLASLQGNVAVARSLLEHQACQHLEIRDDSGMTPLLIACKAGEEDVDHASTGNLGPEDSNEEESQMPAFRSGRHGAVVELLLDRGANPNAKTKLGETVLRLALRSMNFEKVQHLLEHKKVNNEGVLLSSEFNSSEPYIDGKEYDELLNWAASDFARHHFAKLLIQQRHPISASIPSDKASPIACAVSVGLPGVLLLLIANTPWDEKTLRDIRSLKAPDEISHPGGLLQKKKRTERRGKGDDTGTRLRYNSTIQDLLSNPPLGLLRNMHADSKDFELPTAKPLSDISMQFEAAVIQFYKGESHFGSIRRDRSVHEVVYGIGPRMINEGTMKDVERHIKDLKPSFAWIHLPSTNMDWMNDLLQAIMKREGYDPSQFRQVRAFFKASWVEVPDKDLDSRLMRPRFATRHHVQEDKGKTDSITKQKDRLFSKISEKSETKPEDDTQEVTGRSAAASAIYMPYFSYSTQCAAKDESQATSNDCQPSDQEPRELREDDELNRLREKRDRYIQLMSDRVAHRSSTLDEWYYHFDPDDPKSVKDRNLRNESQVVRKYLPKCAIKKQTHWPLIRVNQLWAWTLGDKWLITASSYPVDGNENALLRGILNHLDEQRETVGSRSQPDTAAEMSKLIVDYCIESYERKPKGPNDPKGLLSIRQMFSKAINVIGRDETKLFDDFTSLIKRWKEGLDAKFGQVKRSKDDKASKPQDKRSPEIGQARGTTRNTDNDGKRSGENSVEAKLRKATQTAQELSNSIKDVRDELNILKAAAQYQQGVQEALYRSLERTRMSQEGVSGLSQKVPLMDRTPRLQTNLSAAHVVNDIKEMDSVADRIQTGVNTTLSLQQSEFANLLATLAAKQNRTLMGFTVVTILFLPLSFLTSMFALNKDSFQQVSGWVLAVIFSVSFAFFIPLTGLLFREEVKRYTKEAWDYIRGKNETKSGTNEDPRSPKEEDSDKPKRTSVELQGVVLHE